MKNVGQHDDLESNLTISTGTLGHDRVWFISSPLQLIVIMKLRVSVVCFGRMIFNTIVEMNLTALTGSLRSLDRLCRSGSRFSWLSKSNYALQLCFWKNDRLCDDRNEDHGFGRFPSLVILFLTFIGLFRLIFFADEWS